MAREHALQRLAARQYGVASRQQVLDLGFTRREIDGRLARGLWRRAAPRVYDVAPAAHPDPMRSLFAAVLSSRGWGSHRSAGVLVRLLIQHPRRPELIIPNGRALRALDAEVHRSRNLESCEITRVAGIPCTSVPRTLLDLAHVLDADTFDDTLSHALVTRRTSLRRLDTYLAMPFLGRRGAAPLRDAIDAHRDRSELIQSVLEGLVSRAVSAGRLPPPVHQHPVRVEGRRFVLDLAWPEEQVFVEADGRAFHSTRAQLEQDHRRQNLLVSVGWRPLRYSWGVAKRDPLQIESQIDRVLTQRRRSRGES